ncbi:MAG: helix-turn-helix transcriptional regulator [Fibrella sp.]|nr:helix-turn-helix transcriptional regulator [Armatimonadota bacterium]
MEISGFEQDDMTEEGTGRMIHLTKREVEVLTLVIEGKSSKEVAEHIYISKRTVDYHLANIYKKLDVTNRVQAFREATRRNLLPVGGVFGIAL